MNYKQPLELTGLIANLDAFFREHLSPFWASVVEGLLILIAIVALYAVIALALIYVERKITGFFQSRLGPNRLGKYGSIQSIADMIKILIKEIIHINRADRFLFYVAPFFVIGSSLMAFGAIPFGKGLQAVDFKMGVLYLIAVSSIGVLGVLLAGWSSNNKYSMLGAMRSGAQTINYELSAAFSLMTVVVLPAPCSSLKSWSQRYVWNIFNGHIPALVAFVIFLISGTLRPTGARLTCLRQRELTAVPYRVLGDPVRLLLPGRVPQHVHRRRHRDNRLLGWLDAHPGAWVGRVQPGDVVHPSYVWFFGKTALLIFLSLWVRWTFAPAHRHPA